MSGNQFPLKTNYEMVQILKKYNGSNDIEIVKMEILNDRFDVKYKLEYAGSNKLNMTRTNITMASPPHNFTIMNGLINVVISREFSEFVLTNKYVKDLIEWSKDMAVPHEMYNNSFE